MFAAFCIKNADIPEDSFPVNSGAYAWVAELKDSDQYVDSIGYTPSVGDIAFFSYANSEDEAEDVSEVRADIVGVVSEIGVNDEGNTELKVIIGDLDDSVAEYSVTICEEANSTLDENENIELIGFGILPVQDIDSNADNDSEETVNEDINNEEETSENTDINNTDEELNNESLTLSGENTFEYENKNVVLNVTVDGNIDLGNVTDSDDEITWNDISMKVTKLNDKDSTYIQMFEWAEDNEDGDLYDLTAFQFNFYYGKTELDMSDCEITVKACPTERAISKAMPDQSDEDVIDLGVIYSALEIENNDVEKMDSVTITDEGSENAYVTATLSSKLMVTGLSTASVSNPNFTVQYYAYIPELDMDSGKGDVEKVVLNTSGGVLPKNNGSTYDATKKNYTLSYAEMEQVGSSNNYQFKMNETLTEIYNDDTYSYSRHPGIYYTDILRSNEDYALSEVWVLKDGKSSTSTNANDWTSYTYDEKNPLQFTNVSDNADKDTIYISDGTVLRFVYSTVSTSKTIMGYLYDYNITDGKAYSSATHSGGTSQSSSLYGQAFWENARKSATTYVYTNRQGINSASNYSNTSLAMYAFGNANTGTTLGSRVSGDAILWTDSNKKTNFINRTNSTTNTSYVIPTGQGYEGATFGMVESANVETGELTFDSGISAPSLFSYTINDSSVTGKKTFDNVSINFSKEGDVYSLSSIKSEEYDIDLEDLETFTHYTSYSTGSGTEGSMDIYSNNFWPLDNVSYEGMDPLFGKYVDSGSYGKVADSTLQLFNGNTYGDNGNDALPHDFSPSDDSIDHNSYFGMSFEIEFSMTDNYCGPLEYFFFGDDDLWIFLTPYTENDDGSKTYDYNKQKLILDLGGIHSSIGEYVNLWDYIDEGTNGNYVLSVFYTERGASGSSCSMCYTLPSVTSATPVAATGSLNVEKVVENAAGDVDTTSDKEFNFSINMVDSDGEEIDDSCEYYIYNSNDENKTALSSGSITSGDSFTLKGGQCIQIDYIPCGTVCTVTESDDGRDGYSTTYVIDGGSTQVGTSAEGSIIDDGDNISIVFTNSTSVSLPYTGGEGIYIYIIVGLLLVCVSGKLMYKRYKRKRA